MLVEFVVGPVATPALIWFTIAANLPLALIIPLLIGMLVISNILSHIIIRANVLVGAGGPDHLVDNLGAH